MRKLILLLFVSLLIITSCTKGQGGSGNDSSNSGASNENLIWSSASSLSIICEESSFDVNDFSSYLSDIIGKEVEIITVASDTSNTEHKIIIGNLEYPVSREALAKLEREVDLYSLESSGQSAYLIYAKEGSLGIVYSDSVARCAALNYIMDNVSDEAYRASGVVKSDVFKTEEYLNSARSKARDEDFEKLAAVIDSESASAIRELYKLYDENTYIWLANLYDPDIGGFYYSPSARNTVGFLPDLESTVQALEFLENTGLANIANQKYTKLLPQKTISELSGFVTSLQAENGYFYHPQWGTAISSSRRGRDLGWATKFINATGIVPKYDSPTGGFKGESSVKASSLQLTSSLLSYSKINAVSKVIPVAASSVYSTEESFKAYLDALFQNGDSYSAANSLNSTAGEIKANGRWEFLLNYLRSIQKTNGLWESEVSYNSINGLMKLSEFFGTDFPRAKQALDSVLKIIMLDIGDDVETICYVYNPWVCLDAILPSCTAGERAEIKQFLSENMAELVRITTAKLAAFRQLDGGFSMNQDSSAHTSQGALVAVIGSCESDVNATAIAASTVIKSMFGTYGLKAPSIYCKYDSLHFLDALENMGTIFKDELNTEDPEIITFDDYDPAYGVEENGVVRYPAENVVSNIGDASNFWFTSQIVKNPDSRFDDLVLYAADFTYTDDGVEQYAKTGSNTEFFISNLGVAGECYILDIDLMFAGSDGSSDPVMQIIGARQGTNTQNTLGFNVYTYTRYGKQFLRIGESYAGRDGVQDGEVASGIPADEWFNLRIEAYRKYDPNTSKLDVKIKIYVNGEYAGVSDSSNYNAKSDTYAENEISSFKLAYYRTSPSAFYINNAYVAKANKTYREESVSDSSFSELDDIATVYGFNSGIPSSEDFFIEQFYKDATTGLYTSIDPVNWTEKLESEYGIGTNKGGVRFYESADPKNATNKVLRVFTQNLDSNSGNGTIYINDSNLSAEGTTYEVLFDYYFDTIDFLWRTNEFTLEFQNAAGSKLFGVAFDAREIPESHGGVTEMVMKTDDGTAIDGFVLKSERWYSMKFEYYHDKNDCTNSRMKIYLRDNTGEYICIYDENLYGKTGVVSQLGIRFSAYKVRGNQYLDNVTFAKTDKKYTNETVAKGDDVRISGVIYGDSSAGEGSGNEDSIPGSNVTDDMDNDAWSENDFVNSAYMPTSLTISFYDIPS